jgi:ABC-type nitrate/sulfonate/bicarbonate transport system permease component
MLWFGAGDFSKILIIVMSVSLPLIYHAQQGARSVDDKLLWSAAAMGTGKRRQIFAIILPAALPEILLGVRVGVVIGVIVMVSSEMIVRQNCIGNYLFNALDMAQYELTYAVILIVAIIGFVLDWIFEAIQRRLTFWAPAPRDEEGGGLVSALIERGSNVLARTYSVLVILAAWELVCRGGLVPPGLLPPISAILARTTSALLTPFFLNNVGQTLIRLLSGLVAAVLLGIVIGVAGAQSRLGRRLLEPLIRIFAPIPKIALYPALLAHRAGANRRNLPGAARRLSRRGRGRREADLVGARRRHVAARMHLAHRLSGGAAWHTGRRSHGRRHRLHRRVPQRNDPARRRARRSDDPRRALVPHRRHVRADRRHFAARLRHGPRSRDAAAAPADLGLGETS